jgi:hypothetical protein
MHVIVVMVFNATVLVAQRILERAAIIQNLVDYSPIEKCSQRAVDRNPVERRSDLFFYVRVR